MKMICESEKLDDYLIELDEVNYSHPKIKAKAEKLFNTSQTEIEKAKVAFESGFCYQRLMLFDTPEKGYSLHALNAVYLKSQNKWLRLDARGNKTGVDAQFSIDEEKLAFSVNEQFDEKDYSVIFVKPNLKTITVLKTHTDALEMYKQHLPESI
ncbi:hypothetical protein [Halalkalibacter akibai]|uniref:Uncharacterized protein n=1 Tax=Halalkalibacter akibai (strain ATCC 43226 / DSM 21942 / CIP 109018 / JCM 9157 / 1139) TaxID=1236973 RepID=W4R1U7_HALA3|nr:hypothetical protein [Halalkalibacter akibai]GAE37509.1 hypothetical protein JCM9157_4815 [Halalkalibacter akibai JCM 9157]